MKKNIFVLLLCLSFTSLAFSQEAAVETDSAAASGKTNNEMAIRMGMYFNHMPVIGSLSEHIKDGFGEGFILEMDMPAKTPDWFAFGIPVRAVANYHLLKNPGLELFLSSQITAGIYARFLLANNNIIIQPEIDYGVNLSFARADSFNSDVLKPVYIDQCIQASVGFKWAPQQLKKVKLELELAPTFTLSPTASDLLLYYGGRASILFRVN